MALLVLDMTAAMNFIATQAGDNLSILSPTRDQGKTALCKPLPMLPVQPLRNRRQPNLPHPPLSLITMHEKGLQSSLQDAKNITASDPDQTSCSMYSGNADDSRKTPLSRTSSVYTTASMTSTCSTDSARTTISNIVELYTNLVDKVSYKYNIDEVQILEPEDYRNTVAPLLKRRFSPDIPPVSVLPTQKMPTLHPPITNVISPLSSSRGQAPRFQDFSRNLKSKKSDVVSPLAVNDADPMQNPGLNGGPPSSNTTPQIQSLPFTSNQRSVGRRANHESPISPLSEPDQGVGVQVADGINTQLTAQNGLTAPGGKLWHLHTEKPLQRDKKGTTPLPPGFSQSCEPLQMRDSWPELNRYHRDPATEHNSDSRNTRSGRERTTGLPIATAQDITMNMEQQDRQDRQIQMDRYLAIQMSKAAANVVRESPTASPMLNSTAFTSDLQRRRHTPVQSHGGGRQRQLPIRPLPERHILESVQMPRRPKSETNQRRHKGLSSSRNPDAAESPSSSGKRHTFLTAIESARHSLTSTSAEKRREKLKESIMLVGPSELGSFRTVGGRKGT